MEPVNNYYHHNWHQNYNNYFNRRQYEGSYQYRHGVKKLPDINTPPPPSLSSEDSNHSSPPVSVTNQYHQKQFTAKGGSNYHHYNRNYHHNNHPRQLTYRNRFFIGNGNYSMQTNGDKNVSGLQNSSQLYYELISQADVRHFVTYCNQRVERQISGPAGSFFSQRQYPHHRRADYTAEAKGFPQDLISGNVWDKLSQQVWKMFSQHQQLDTTFKAKMELKDRICHVIWVRIYFAL